MLSFHGIGARLLAGFGDDRTRPHPTAAGGPKAYAGAVPITRAPRERKYVGRAALAQGDTSCSRAVRFRSAEWRRTL